MSRSVPSRTEDDVAIGCIALTALLGVAYTVAIIALMVAGTVFLLHHIH